MVEANQRSHRNFRAPPTCIFKQTEDAAQLLLIKSHQSYQDIILLKHHLSDLLPQYEPNTNLPSPNSLLTLTSAISGRDSSSNIDDNSFNSSPQTIVVELIDQFISTLIALYNVILQVLT